ncbi:MAG: peptidase MA family metallohydrolase, partial [Desulfobacterales bacterium]|nr:peptidase MA family metallohydrolase [Desulfobacterales bacterium]
MASRLTLSILLFVLGAPLLVVATPSVVESPELTVFHDAGLEPSVQQAVRIYTDAKQELQTLLQWPLKFRPTLVLMNDRQKFLQMAGHPLVVAYALPAENVMVIDHTQMKIAPFNLRATIQHELCHLMLHHSISAERLPRWLDEGVCQWASDGLADIIMDSRRALLPSAILSDRYFEFASLNHRFPQDKNGLILAYEQSKSMVEHMSRTYGTQGVLDLLALLRQGATLESAVETRFGVSFDQLEAQWRDQQKKNINWFTYLSIHLYEILFVSAALLTLLAYVRR